MHSQNQGIIIPSSVSNRGEREEFICNHLKTGMLSYTIEYKYLLIRIGFHIFAIKRNSRPAYKRRNSLLTK